MNRIEKIDNPSSDLGYYFRFVTGEGETVGHYVPRRSTLERLAGIAEKSLEAILADSEMLISDLARESARQCFSEYFFNVGSPTEALDAAKATYDISHPLPM
ncbi:hypothetical protein [Arthrobacter sp.]|uniref:hypothetical protein n=1 Tax=Arthrobacter sp. TaxID=1667 RepID=UPI003A944037